MNGLVKNSLEQNVYGAGNIESKNKLEASEEDTINKDKQYRETLFKFYEKLNMQLPYSNCPGVGYCARPLGLVELVFHKNIKYISSGIQL